MEEEAARRFPDAELPNSVMYMEWTYTTVISLAQESRGPNTHILWQASVSSGAAVTVAEMSSNVLVEGPALENHASTQMCCTLPLLQNQARLDATQLIL